MTTRVLAKWDAPASTIAKAFELREHSSERERLLISAEYYQQVTGQLDKAAQTFREWLESYPQSTGAHNDLGDHLRSRRGNTRNPLKRCALTFACPRKTPSHMATLRHCLLALQRFDEARQVIQQVQARKLDDFGVRIDLYALAFLSSDSTAMAEQQKWFEGRPEENMGLSLASDTEAYAGRLGKAREVTRQAVNSAVRADSKETGAIWLANAALREAAFGNAAEAKQAAAEALKLAPASQGVGRGSRAWRMPWRAMRRAPNLWRKT